MLLTDVKLPIEKGEDELIKIAQKKLGKYPAFFAVRKKSLDARDKQNIRYVYTIEFSAQKQVENEEILEKLPKGKLPQKPVLVVGAGPAGLFCGGFRRFGQS
jgi:uncharacterized FAD-dependent dehydrogenase